MAMLTLSLGVGVRAGDWPGMCYAPRWVKSPPRSTGTASPSVFFEAGSPVAHEEGLKLLILLPLPTKFWNGGHAQPHPVHVVLGIEARVYLAWLGQHSTSCVLNHSLP